MKTLRIMALASSALALTASPAFAANLLTNGGFEAPIAGGFFQNFTSGSTGVTGWTVDAFTPFGGSGGNVDIVNGAFTPSGPSPAAEGAQFLDLVGFGTVGSIYQTFATVAGERYNVSFAYSHNMFGGDPAASADFAVYGGVFTSLVTPFLTFAHSTGTSTNLDWQTYSYSFVADGAQSTIAFGNATGGLNAGVFLDAVSVTAVPEPATWAMMISGFALVGGAMRRRNVKTRFSFA
jgi:Protein of unknown function (DUF642)/PEP-CTERM motif